jgi:hypothetical protein
MQFTVIQDGYAPMDISLNQPGMHNVQNACAAIAIARELGVADGATQKALTEFNGVGRRFTRYGDIASFPKAAAPLPWWTTMAITRWKPRPRWRRRAAPIRAGAWCWRSSRIATPAPATCSRTS